MRGYPAENRKDSVQSAKALRINVLSQYLPPQNNLFKTIDAGEAARSLNQLLEQVALGDGRIEIVGTREGCVCVLVSKTELDALERAISILSGTAEAQAMRELLGRIASAASRSVEGSLQTL